MATQTEDSDYIMSAIPSEKEVEDIFYLQVLYINDMYEPVISLVNKTFSNRN